MFDQADQSRAEGMLCAGCSVALEIGENLVRLFEDSTHDVYQCRYCLWLNALPRSLPGDASQRTATIPAGH